MLDLVQIADNCGGLLPIVKLIRSVIGIFQIAIPILLIVWGSIDLGKAVMSSDEKEIKGATSKLIKRAIAAVVVFFIPFIVNLIMGLVAGTADNTTGGTENAMNFAKCWEEAGQ